MSHRQWGRMFVRVCPYFPFPARLWLDQHHWLANVSDSKASASSNRAMPFSTADPDASQKLADSLTAQDLIRCGQKWLRLVNR
ncbi:MAG: hypothetical protein EXQ58_12765 [Acidobacteria bacterium]|nr:hypothetical protein [Acidobacteriota bacterium]